MKELIILSINAKQRQEAEKLIYQAAVDNRLSCTDAINIADSLGIPSQEIGKLATMLQIKISKCRLGCF